MQMVISMAHLLVGLALVSGEHVVGIATNPLDIEKSILLQRALRVDSEPRQSADEPGSGSLRFAGVHPAAADGAPIIVSAGQVHSAYTPCNDLQKIWRYYWEGRQLIQTGSRPLQMIDLSHICDLTEPVTILEADFAPGNVSAVELIAIAQITKHFKPKACFEIGTFDGRTTLNLAANAQGRVYTLDLPADSIGRTRYRLAGGDRVFVDKLRSGERYQASPLRKRITQLYGDSAAFDYAPYLGAMDIVFVDGSHAYNYVRADLETAYRLLRRRPDGETLGVIIIHDYGVWEGVTRALEEAQQVDMRFARLQNITGTSLAIARFGRHITSRARKQSRMRST
ncbi:MAG: class I SAM-dependent methyltransferase [Alphaproteobacteria bacterium]